MISGFVLNKFMQPVFGAQMEAVKNNVSLVAGMSGIRFSDQGEGEYFIHGLEPGKYLIKAVPVNGDSTIGDKEDLSYIWQNLENNFETQYYKFGNSPEDAEIVEVFAGKISPNINFILPTGEEETACGEPSIILKSQRNQTKKQQIICMFLLTMATFLIMINRRR